MSLPPHSERVQRITRLAQDGRLIRAVGDPGCLRLLEAEATDPALRDVQRLVTVELLDTLLRLHQEQLAKQRGPTPLFRRRTQVFLLPGFMGSWLRDVQGGYGTVWYHPLKSYFNDRLGLLELAGYVPGHPERDRTAGVRIEPSGLIGLIYDALHWALRIADHSVEQVGIDWRKDLDLAAQDVMARVARSIDSAGKPIYLIAHSQGALVARRALQLLYAEPAYADRVLERVKGLILLGPANYGSFSAAFGFAGNHDSFDLLKRIAVEPPIGLGPIMRSMTGAYQLLPADEDRLPHLRQSKFDVRKKGFWGSLGIDEDRLATFAGWSSGIDTSFIADRTRIILGDNKGADTAAGVRFVGGELFASHLAHGDGTVPDPLAYLDGATHHRARETEHLWLPTYAAVIRAITRALDDDLNVPLPVVAIGQLKRVRAVEDPVPLSALTPADAVPPILVRPPEPATPPTPSPANRFARPDVPAPSFRPLRVFTFDPLLSTQLDTRGINQITLPVRWEADLQPGPIGEYLEVVDYDPSSRKAYPPIDLNHPHVLATGGLAPSESSPQFHQQMVYAVAMTTIDTFEKALGRPVLWSPREVRDARGRPTDWVHVPRLRIYPHALRQRNAYYSSDKKSLLFGYFQAVPTDAGKNLPRGTVFACLSQEIVAHEMTHAVLDGIHERFLEPSNPDVLAFHEAFADLVALFGHFSHPDVVRDQIARTRSDLRQENLLGKLAVQFGQARGDRGALRDAIGKIDPKTGQWKPHDPKPTDYGASEEAHDRGSVLVAAVFDAFLTIYHRRIRDLLRIATNGTGVLPAGELHPDLVNRLAIEAGKSARHVLQMCIRALDYMPPVDFTFGEYLRAVITADFDLVRDDDRGYRVAVIDAFRQRGIYPQGVRSLAEESLRWQGPAIWFEFANDVLQLLRGLRCLRPDVRRTREQLFEEMRRDRRDLHEALYRQFTEYGALLGLNLDDAERNGSYWYSNPYRQARSRPKVEVHAVRPVSRIGPDGQHLNQLVVVLHQQRRGYFDPEVQKRVEAGPPGARNVPEPDFVFRGGCTVLIDLDRGRIRYAVLKDITSDRRLERQREYEQRRLSERALRATYFQGRPSERLARMHGA